MTFCSAKVKSKMEKVKNSTSSSLGLRLCGMQVLIGSSSQVAMHFFKFIFFVRFTTQSRRVLCLETSILDVKSTGILRQTLVPFGLSCETDCDTLATRLKRVCTTFSTIKSRFEKMSFPCSSSAWRPLKKSSASKRSIAFIRRRCCSSMKVCRLIFG